MKIWLAVLILSCIGTLAQETAAARTSLSDSGIRFTTSAKPYAVLRRGPIEAVIVDNSAVDDEILGGHRAGYHGIASLKHERQKRNLFVPAFAGLNFEHIHDGTAQDRKILFEPRSAPMQLRIIDSRTAELYQPPTPYWGLESCLRYALLDNETIEVTFECIPRRDTYKNGYIGLFWASYIDHPESRDVHFLIPDNRPKDAPAWRADGKWVQASSPEHGVLATHRGLGDDREFKHDSEFPLTLVFNFSPYRYAAPWYLGVCRDMAFIQVFRPQDKIRFSQSPSGGGDGNPAWDFQWFIPNYKIGQRYQFVMRILYTIHEANFFNPFESEDKLFDKIKRAREF
jgi:hypothetical protein